MTELARAARIFLRACDTGTLATVSLRHAGYPFGSVVAYALDAEACPVILVSGLAEHSRNLARDPRCSLLARRTSSLDPQAEARVTLVADAARHDTDPRLRARFLRLVPGAAQLLQLGDFFFMKLQPVAIRYIGGFGAVHWLKPADYGPPRNDIAGEEQSILEGLSQTHRGALAAACRGTLGRVPADLELLGLDCDGIDLRGDGARLRFDYPEPVTRAAGIPAALDALASGLT